MLVQNKGNFSQSKFIEGAKTYENDESHFEFVFNPNFQPDALADLNSENKPIDCFFYVIYR